MRLIACFAILIFISSCETTRISEQNIDLDNSVWPVDSLVKFSFSVKHSDVYKISMNLRNSGNYGFQNIYIGYWLKDSLEQVILTNTVELKNIDNFQLFDPKTGTPLGRGLGDIFEHRFVLEDSLKLESGKTYSMEFQHYMRDQNLKGVLSIGYRLDQIEK